jgi:hypothetical protein
MNLSRFVSIAALALAATAWADNLTVQATADIYAAGQPTLPASDGSISFPPSITFGMGSANFMTFSVFDNTLACDFSIPIGAEGSCYSGDTQIAGESGLSGIIAGGADMFLAGVFLDNNQPSGSGPDGLSYNTSDPSSLSRADATYSPQIGQVFFIGDGLAGGLSQMFIIPSTATRLFLGFTGDSPGSAPLFNSVAGSIDVDITPASEPSGFFLIGGGLLAVVSRLTRRHKI